MKVNPDKVLVLVPSGDKLPLFLGTGMEELSSEITNRYTFDGWLSSFLNKA